MQQRLRTDYLYELVVVFIDAGDYLLICIYSIRLCSLIIMLVVISSEVHFNDLLLTVSYINCILPLSMLFLLLWLLRLDTQIYPSDECTYITFYGLQEVQGTIIMREQAPVVREH